jgi:hypothetical protein
VTTLTARPTIYNGIPMRSRLEARVAAYLDALGLRWQYEPSAYGGRDGQYLPDFVITPTSSADEPPVFLEVKGPQPTPDEEQTLLRRMMVIRSSEANATLAFMSADMLEAGYWALCGPPQDTWHDFLCLQCPERDSFGLRPVVDEMVSPWCREHDPDRVVQVSVYEAADYILAGH